MGMVPEDHGANLTEWVSEYRPSGELVFSKDVRGLAKAFPYPWQFIHRVDLHNALKDLATRPAGKGVPAILHLKSKVVSVNTDQVSLTLEDGSTHVGDLLIGADGVHSKIRSLLVKKPPPEPSGSSAFRFTIPVELVRSDPVTARFVEKTGEMLLFYGLDRRIVVYPCRNNTLLNFVAMHPDEETAASTEEWNASASKELMLGCFTTYPEDVRALLAKVSPDDIKLWKLLDHEELGRENWVHGKLALIGDAAHAFLPHQGQGGAQAIEDGAALGALFPLGTLASDITRRLELFVKARYDRATMVQDFTRQAALKNSKSKDNVAAIDPMQFTEINFTHDAFDNAHGILLRELSKNALYRRMPLSFGPSPGPRQDLRGRARKPGKMSYKTSYITFRTHKSYISTLLPSDAISLPVRGSFATATFAVTRLANLDWLGGRGYSMFGLYIHGAVCEESNKSTGVESKSGGSITGDFLPVLFENRADPIITGREELGFSKVYATLEESSSSETSFSLSAGWDGTEFCNFTLDGLAEDLDQTPLIQNQVIHYKVIASSNEAQGVDAEYVTTSSPLPTFETERRWKASKAELNWTDLEGGELEQAFPTLANIVKGLRDIKIVEVLECGMKMSE